LIAKILVVDDDPHLRMLLRDHFSSKGHVVLEASDGAEAFAVAEKEMPHLILMDLVMPGVYGSSAAQRLHDYWRTSKIPIVVMSAFTDEPVKGLLRENKNLRFLRKPFDLGSLDKLVEELLPLGGYTP
jgi:DNA-binding response OmpR family regulator